MKIDRLMTRKLVTIGFDDSLNEIKGIFEEVSFHHLLVVEKGKLFGIISDRDLFKSLSPSLGTAAETQKDLSTLSKKAHQIMTRKPITLQAHNTAYEAIDIFIKKSISCIPIVDEDNQPVGILSWRDILKALAAKHHQE